RDAGPAPFSRPGRVSGLRAVHAAALALEEGARLDRQGLVRDVADELGRLRQDHRLALERAVDRSADADAVAGTAAAHLRALPHRDRAALHVALDLAVDLNVAIADQIAFDLEVAADDRVPVAAAVAIDVAVGGGARRLRHRHRLGRRGGLAIL